MFIFRFIGNLLRAIWYGLNTLRRILHLILLLALFAVLLAGVVGQPMAVPASAALVINPNTVLKAYRELEHEGLVEGRHGQGTYVVRSLSGPSPGTLDELRTSLETWVAQARAAGRRRRAAVCAPLRGSRPRPRPRSVGRSPYGARSRG